MNKKLKPEDLDVIILCGGKGTRLRNIISDRPKALAEINGVPLVDVLTRYVYSFGFRRFILCIGYKGNQIRQYFEKNNFPDLEILFSDEKSALGTAGAVKNAQKLIRSNRFLVLNGDTFCSLDFNSFIDFHIEKNAQLSIALVESKRTFAYGAVKLDDCSRIISYDEKKTGKHNGLINAGIYLIDGVFLSNIPEGKNFSLENEVFPNIKNGFYGFISNAEFIDIGTPKNFKLAQKLKIYQRPQRSHIKMSSDAKRKITFGTISVTNKSKELINKIVDSGRVSCGRYVREFEREFAKLMGTKEAVAVSSGTDADALALAVLYDFAARREDEIIVPSLSFVSTGNAVLQAGFKPVFADIDRKTLNIDPQKIERLITKKTRAIMPVHLMGKPADMDSINAIAKKHKLLIIEDAAEAYGTFYKGRPAGTLGDMGAFSLYVAHMVSTGEGGAVVTNKPEFADVLRSLRSHGRACKCESCVLNISSGYCDKRFKYGQNRDIRFIFERIGFSAKMNELEAAIGLGNLEIYPQILKQRRKNLLYMIGKFKEFQPYLYTIEEGTDEQIGPHAFPIILKENVKFSRDKFVYFLEQKGIDSRSLFLSMPTQCEGFKYLGYKLGDFPEAEYIGDNGLHIGVHQDLKKEDIDYILNTIRDFLKGNV